MFASLLLCESASFGSLFSFDFWKTNAAAAAAAAAACTCWFMLMLNGEPVESFRNGGGVVTF